MSQRPIPAAGAATGTTSTRGADDWRKRAACLDADPEVFFAEGETLTREQLQAAASYCNRCPVWDACLKDAEATDVRYGVRAGRDRYQGQRPARKQRTEAA